MRLSYLLIFYFLSLFLGNPIFASADYLKFPSPDESCYFAKEIVFQDTLNSPYRELNHAINEINIGNKDSRFNGTILVGHKGKLVYLKSFGVSDKSAGIKQNIETPTQIASITKTFTGTAIMWLQEKGVLNINDKVQQYIWEFPYQNITIEHLLSHRSGLRDYIKFSGKYWGSSAPMYNEEVLKQFINYGFGLRFNPGNKFNYSNSNYAFLALIIERISGMTYSDFMERYIFEPLNMDNTFVFDPLKQYNFHIAKSYRSNFNNWENTYQDGVYGDKGIFTTAEDLFKWDKALYSNQFISQENKDDAFTPRSPWKVSKNYGLGWRIKTYPSGEKYVYHTGWWHGYQGIFSRYLEDEFTVIILSNRYIKGITKNAEAIYDIAKNYLSLTELECNMEG